MVLGVSSYTVCLLHDRFHPGDQVFDMNLAVLADLLDESRLRGISETEMLQNIPQISWFYHLFLFSGLSQVTGLLQVVSKDLFVSQDL